MSWARLDDGFWTHPKVMIAGNTAAGIFARLLSYSGCYLTNGLVPAQIVELVVGKDKRALEALEQYGMVQRLETGSVVIPDYLDYNPSKDDIEEIQRKRREAGKKGGRAARNGRAHA